MLQPYCDFNVFGKKKKKKKSDQDEQVKVKCNINDLFIQYIHVH